MSDYRNDRRERTAFARCERSCTRSASVSQCNAATREFARDVSSRIIETSNHFSLIAHSEPTLTFVVCSCLPALSDELIRQVTIESPERGLLLMRVRDEVR